MSPSCAEPKIPFCFFSAVSVCLSVPPSRQGPELSPGSTCDNQAGECRLDTLVTALQALPGLLAQAMHACPVSGPGPEAQSPQRPREAPSDCG